MEIDLSRLNASDLVLSGTVRLPEDDGSGPLEDDGIRFPDAFAIEARARRDSLGVILVEGQVEGKASLECGRCLEWFDHSLSLDFESRHRESVSVHAGVARVAPGQPGRPVSGRPMVDDIALDVAALQDDERHFGSPAEDVVDLPEGCRVLPMALVVREQVLVALPLRPLCRPDCLGLCPACGGNRNETACSCSTEKSDSSGDARLAVLAELRKKLERQ